MRRQYAGAPPVFSGALEKEWQRMDGRYVVFDVETPNYANDRMSAIGVTVVDGGWTVEDFFTLVNPETYFNSFNIQLTGITPEMAAEAPAFPELWERLEPVMADSVLVAHNAPFDMAVLAKCLDAYGIGWRPYSTYACTCAMGRACYPELANHKLDTMCRYLDIGLDHHNAGSDSRACAELLLDYMRRGLDVRRYHRRYDMLARRTLRF